MDDLLASLGAGSDAGIGLHLVGGGAAPAPAPAAPATAAPADSAREGKIRRREYLERRKGKHRRKREGVTAGRGRPAGGSAPAAVPPAVPAEAEAVPRGDDGNDVPSEDEVDPAKERETDDVGERGVAEYPSDDDDDDTEPEEVAEDPPRALSRRVHDADALDDESARADYLASFHARPHELDRRSAALHGRERAVRAVNAGDAGLSVPSDRIFGGADGAAAPAGDGDGAAPSPFAALGLHPRICGALAGMGLGRPTVIQTVACEMLLRKKGGGQCNLYMQSETGSGKTLAYLLPILQKLAIDPHTDAPLPIPDRALHGTRALILCPTRELAAQTLAAASRLCAASFRRLVPGALSGGEKRKSEKARIRKGVHLLVATPGRMADHLQKTDALASSLRSLEWVVLDEADRLLDMGLGKQVGEILTHLRGPGGQAGAP
eukprot:CAMPEP_0194269560 /NCGR_PEP_ID=MMETSP0169-20130528/3687_1 /TAXON_ID=218684 /ORGANISM="Corethron pennatum, Strain L29A3" /LENGTH=435 /DNA_ID=CAMNT_0039011245 /DNA_START=124 /DNA_END=1427 /DNA_ORIENTATION=-